MGSQRTQAAVVLFALGWLPAYAQSLGDVARAERERRSKITHHAPVLTNDDLRRDKILQKAPLDPDAASHSSDNGTDAASGEDVSLGDYVRTLRQRLAADQNSASSATAAGGTPESQSTDSNPVTLTPLSEVGKPSQKTLSLGEFARRARAEREAARAARMHSNRPPAATHDTNPTSSAEAAPPRVRQGDRAMPGKAASPNLARSSEVRPKPGAPRRQARQPRAMLEPGAMANGESIRVPRGSSLWRLAREHLGAGRLWPALWKANPQIRDPNRIQAGQLLRCPVLRDQERTHPSRRAALERPNSAGIAPASPVATVVKSPVTTRSRPPAGRLAPTASGIHPSEQARKSLSSRALSR